MALIPDGVIDYKGYKLDVFQNDSASIEIAYGVGAMVDGDWPTNFSIWEYIIRVRGESGTYVGGHSLQDAKDKAEAWVDARIKSLPTVSLDG